jgi:glycosyltransferase involved in cell wall biosynthesis
MSGETYLLIQRWGKDLGGVESWGWSIKALLEKRNPVRLFAFRECSTFKKLWYCCRMLSGTRFVLMDYRMIVFLPLVLLKALFKNVDIFIILHGDEVLKMSFFHRIILNSLNGLYKFTFIANSNYTAEVYKKISKSAVVFVVHPFDNYKPYLSNLFNSAQTKKLLNSGQQTNSYQVSKLDVLSICIIARLVKRKNHENVIRAILIISNMRLPFTVKLKIAGDGPEQENLKILIHDLGLRAQIELLGKITEERKRALLDTSDLFVMPTLSNSKELSIEGFGISYIEACCHGCPSIYVPVGGVVDAVIDNVTGISCDGSPESIASAILKAVNVDWDVSAFKEHVLKFDSSAQQTFETLIWGRDYCDL